MPLPVQLAATGTHASWGLDPSVPLRASSLQRPSRRCQRQAEADRDRQRQTGRKTGRKTERKMCVALFASYLQPKCRDNPLRVCGARFGSVCDWGGRRAFWVLHCSSPSYRLPLPGVGGIPWPSAKGGGAMFFCALTCSCWPVCSYSFRFALQAPSLVFKSVYVYMGVMLFDVFFRWPATEDPVGRRHDLC